MTNNDNGDDIEKEIKKQTKKHKKKIKIKEESVEKKKRKKDSNKIEEKHKKKKRQKRGDLLTALFLTSKCDHATTTAGKRKLPFDIKYVLAPMVGASELPFRLLCRKYGTNLAYTPMLSSEKFISDESYRNQELPNLKEDRPLVAHFSANNPKIFSHVAQIIEKQNLADAIDLNLGCPQRTAYVGHFGSYLLDDKDRQLIVDIVQSAANAVKTLPIFVKIRLLNTIEETITLCEQLRDAGVSLIAIHARYRASFERKGAGARDGPAMLDQVKIIKEKLGDSVHIISNGNVITYQDVENNLESTNADGIMSAEGILDNPALFLPQYNNNNEDSSTVSIPYSYNIDNKCISNITNHTSNNNDKSSNDDNNDKTKRKLIKKLRAIQIIEQAIKKDGEDGLNSDQKEKLKSKQHLETTLASLNSSGDDKTANISSTAKSGVQDSSPLTIKKTSATLLSLTNQSKNKLDLANEYLTIIEQKREQLFPHIPLRTIIFHIRRIIKDILNQYQLMEVLCINSKTIEDIRNVINKCYEYQNDPTLFKYDNEKDKLQKAALKRKKEQEKNRKRYEDRLIRKAKREGLNDVEHYVKEGLKYVPSIDDINDIKQIISKDEQIQAWKDKNFHQHCLMYHLNDGKCVRDRSCAFLHVEIVGSNKNSFVEDDEVNG